MLFKSDERGRRRVPRRWLDAEHASFMIEDSRGPSHAKSAAWRYEGNQGVVSCQMSVAQTSPNDCRWRSIAGHHVPGRFETSLVL